MRSLIIIDHTIADNQRENEELVTVAFLGIEIYRKQEISSPIKPSALMTIRILGITVWAKEYGHQGHLRRLTTYKLFGRLRRFIEAYPDPNVKVPAAELFDWHNRLTGSCLMGRKEFCKAKGLDYENGSYTVNEFIALTLNAYGGNIISQLNDTYLNK